VALDPFGLVRGGRLAGGGPARLGLGRGVRAGDPDLVGRERQRLVAVDVAEGDRRVGRPTRRQDEGQRARVDRSVRLIAMEGGVDA
jgi:hypothetical protein